MKTPLVIRQTGSTNAGTPVNILSQRVPAGQLWLILGVAIDNESGESVTAAFGVVDIEGFTRISAKQSVASADCFSGTAWMLLREGDQLAVQVTGTANKSTVTLVASGVVLDETEEVTILPQGAS